MSQKKSRKIKKTNNDNISEVNILHLPISLEKLLSLTIHFDKLEPLGEIYPPKPPKIVTISGGSETVSIYNNNITETTKNDKIIAKKNRDLVCWWCCHEFDVYPISCPEYFSQKNEIFTVKGIFCSFNCVKAYMLDKNSKNLYLVSYLFKKIKGYYSKIIPALPKELLKIFGGNMTIEEYRKNFISVTEYYTNTFPMVYSKSEVEIHEENKNYTESVLKVTNQKNTVNKLNEITVNTAKERVSKRKGKETKKDDSLLKLMNIKIVD